MNILNCVAPNGWKIVDNEMDRNGRRAFAAYESREWGHSKGY
jgi:hypothetical protein